MTDAWVWERRRGPAEILHATTPPKEFRPTAWVLDIDGPALVLGSSQSRDAVDLERAAAAGIRPVGRRSGGGAVLLVPGDHVWVDVWVPRGTRWWDDDVIRASAWLAEVWVDALTSLGVEKLDVHRGALTRTRWSRQVCFAGLGPGEVCADGRKLVGVSQRRTREWARFQCVVHRRWDAVATFALLSDTDALEAGVEWRDRIAVVGDLDVEAAFASALLHS